MGTELIVFPAPLLYQDPGFGQSGEHLPIEQLIPQLAIERFYVAVLPGAPSLYEEGLHAQTVKPGSYCPGSEFGTVVRPNMLRNASQDEQLKQLVDDILGGDMSGNQQRQTLPRVLVHKGEYPEGSSISCPGDHKVIAPDMILVLRSESHTGAIIQP